MTNLFRVSLFIVSVLLLSACAPKEAEYPVLNGGAIKFSELKGKVVFVNYWALWCAPCREEIPALNQLQQAHPEDVVVLGVNFDGVAGEKLAGQVAELDIQFDTLLADPKSMFGVKASGVLPETLVIDRRGQFHRVLLGPQTQSDLEEVLFSLMEDIEYQ